MEQINGRLSRPACQNNWLGRKTIFQTLQLEKKIAQLVFSFKLSVIRRKIGPHPRFDAASNAICIIFSLYF
jgi:hypothetical protein